MWWLDHPRVAVAFLISLIAAATGLILHALGVSWVFAVGVAVVQLCFYALLLSPGRGHR